LSNLDSLNGLTCNTGTPSVGVVNIIYGVNGIVSLTCVPTTLELLTVSAGSGGTVTSDIVGINCGISCSHSYPYNVTVSLSAAQQRGYRFVGWGGDCSGTSSCTVSMTAPRNVTATFQATVQLQLQALSTSGSCGFASVCQGQGNFGVSSASGTLGACQTAVAFGVCNPITIDLGTTVTVTAYPGTDTGVFNAGPSSFVGWDNSTLCPSTTSLTCTFTLAGDASIGATFGP
jgi:uncharacterized repeat protein (TIGR02543 family)